MKTKVGVGYSNQTDSFAAGKEATAAALENGGLEKADFALIFCGGKHNPKEFLEGVNSLIPTCQKAGGTSFGIITDSFIGYDGFEVGVTLFSSEKIKFTVLAQGNLNENEFVAGDELGKKIESAGVEDLQALWVFYDSSKNQSPPMLNFATPLFAALEPHLPKGLPCAGGGFLADMRLSQCFQFVDDKIVSQHALAILISGECTMETTILHGCHPCSDYLTVTKAEGPVVFEIDHRPAVDVIHELLGGSEVVDIKDFAMNVTLGINRGEKFGEFKESEFANRLTLAVDEPNKALVMFEPDLVAGSEVQLMHRNLEPDYLNSVIDGVKDIIHKLNPVFSLYINCGGRARPFSGVNFEDAESVQDAVGSVPLAGFYSGVEVARVGEFLQPLDWTGVLCFLAEK